MFKYHAFLVCNCYLFEGGKLDKKKDDDKEKSGVEKYYSDDGADKSRKDDAQQEKPEKSQKSSGQKKASKRKTKKTKKPEKARKQKKKVRLRHKPRRRRKKKKPVFAYVFGLVILAALVLLFMNLEKLMPESKPPAVRPEQEQVIVATVNGEPIYIAEINQQYDVMPANYRQSITKELILNKTIEEVLLLQEAANRGITTNTSEVDDLLDMLIKQSGITQEMLDMQLKQNNMTMDDLRQVYRKQIIITKLINETVLSKIEVSDEEIEEFYNNNLDSPTIKVEDQVKARHILVANESVAQEILAKLSEGGSFAELAKEYSMDTASAQNGGDLGYFSEGMMVEEFNDAAFSMEIDDEPEIVQTKFGYHIVDVTGKKDERIRPLDEVRETVISILKEKKQNDEIAKYLAKIKEEAEITIYPGRLSDELPEGVDSFSKLGDDVCTKGGKPIIRAYATTTCPRCKWISEDFMAVAKEYANQGKIVAHYWLTDIQDDKMTEEAETVMPDPEMLEFIRGNQGGFVPYFSFGCKYSRIGNAYEGAGDHEKERAEFRALIEALLEDTGNYAEEDSAASLPLEPQEQEQQEAPQSDEGEPPVEISVE